MAQANSWDKEYRNKKMLSGFVKPQNAFLTYLKYLKKQNNKSVTNYKILDLGSGTGRNANYLASLGNEVIGIEISKEAIKISESEAKKNNVTVKYIKKSIGEPLPFLDKSFGIVLDITTSNALTEKERKIYLSEVHRVLKKGGYFFVRTLLKDGDKNAQNLIKLSPGPEKDTYLMKELGITERVFALSDFLDMYKEFFNVDKIIKTEGRVEISSKVYKRKYLIAYLINK